MTITTLIWMMNMNPKFDFSFADAWQIGYDRGYDDSESTGQIEPDPDFSPDLMQYYYEGYAAGADEYYADHDINYRAFPDDSMDGDFDSGMASAGHGTDESYGDYGQDDIDF